MYQPNINLWHHWQVAICCGCASDGQTWLTHIDVWLQLLFDTNVQNTLTLVDVSWCYVHAAFMLHRGWRIWQFRMSPQLQRVSGGTKRWDMDESLHRRLDSHKLQVWSCHHATSSVCCRISIVSIIGISNMHVIRVKPGKLVAYATLVRHIGHNGPQVTTNLFPPATRVAMVGFESTIDTSTSFDRNAACNGDAPPPLEKSLPFFAVNAWGNFHPTNASSLLMHSRYFGQAY